jgi:hypothetical protein
MFDHPPPERIRTDLPIKGLVLFVVGIGMSFGLCGVSAFIGGKNFIPTIAGGAFLLSVLGCFVCVIWLVVAIIANSFRG